MTVVEPGSFAAYRREVTALTDVGESMERIERVIAEAPLPHEQRDALWLLGWCLHERRARETARPVDRGRPA